ncbi:hypothetical protein EVG20_g1887 [Dentipellis fragilis]|uniref:Uncharacterized protein n=1 Tax=Dentipellis fragilis TaxID=205917 RepID=A0A4Y9ZBD7_9AGAM|nr:hypothetical protein EVG20_g1887 [Dentipellis fragilis]
MLEEYVKSENWTVVQFRKARECASDLRRQQRLIRRHLTCFVRENPDSVELAILAHDSDSTLFSKGDDSGALIVDAQRPPPAAFRADEASKRTNSLDTTFAMLMEWAWDLIKDKSPGANV